MGRLGTCGYCAMSRRPPSVSRICSLKGFRSDTSTPSRHAATLSKSNGLMELHYDTMRKRQMDYAKRGAVRGGESSAQAVDDPRRVGLVVGVEQHERRDPLHLEERRQRGALLVGAGAVRACGAGVAR